MNSLFEAAGLAAPAWQQAVAQLAWTHLVVAAAYGAAAWLCLLNRHSAMLALQGTAPWTAATLILVLLALNGVLCGEVFVTHWLRELAQLNGWYEHRRPVQYLAALGALGALTWCARRGSGAGRPEDPAVRRVVVGLAVLLGLLALRTVSAHGTDAVLTARLAGVSLGRWLELGAIVWMGRSALQALNTGAADV
jgi:hypothetical protein